MRYLRRPAEDMPPIERDYVVQSPTPLGQRKVTSKDHNARNSESFAEIAEQLIDDVQSAFPEDDGTVRHAEALASFVAYCAAHPKQRFWQALRNWSRYHTIFGFNGDVYAFDDSLPDDILVDLHDTFYIEGLDGTREQ